MKLTPDPFTIIGQKHEAIDVEIQCTGTTHAVQYQLNEGNSRILSPGQSLTFTLIQDPTILTLFFSFSNPQGGSYVIRIRGGAEVSEYTLKQAPNPGPDATLTYTFDLGGDETKQGY
jgi:hypothetical protein